MRSPFRRALAFAAAALALAGCASSRASPPPAAEDPASLAREEKEGFPAPDLLQEGDRWYVAVRPEESRKPFAVRNRRRSEGDLVREEVVWGRSFDEVARAAHGTMQVVGLILDGRGLSIALLDESGKPVGQPSLEVAVPLRPGNTWEISVGDRFPKAVGLVERVEEVDTPGGKVRALRVSQRALAGEVWTSTIWYDRGLRPVRFEFRKSGNLLEAQAALPSPEPTPEECRGAVDWAAKNLAK